jgi:phage terminase small subunit
MDNKLTPKQEAFAQKYVELGNASEAYRFAYDVSEDTKPETIWKEAYLLLGNPKVAPMVEKLQQEHRERHSVTVDSLTQELEEARMVAIAEGQGAAMTSATMGKAKLHGLLVDKNETKLDTTDTFAALVLKAVDGKTRTT